MISNWFNHDVFFEELLFKEITIETSSTKSFVSYTDGFQYVVNKLNDGYEFLLSNQKFYLFPEIDVAKIITAKFRFDIKSDSLHQDFVIRFKIEKKKLNCVITDDEELFHQNKNRLVQKDVRCVSLKSLSNRIYDLNFSFSSSFNVLPYIYFRDEPGNYWICHIRFLPPTSNKTYWFRWYTRFGKLLSFRFNYQNYLIKSLSNKILYKAEKNWGSINYQTQPLFDLHHNDYLNVSAKVHKRQD